MNIFLRREIEGTRRILVLRSSVYNELATSVEEVS
jgi:hypothetical protein